MKLATRFFASILATTIANTAIAQTAVPTYLKGNQPVASQATVILDTSGNPLGTTANPIKTAITGTPSIAVSNFPGTQTISGAVSITGTPSFTCVGGCSSGGSGGAVTQGAGSTSNPWTVGGVVLTPTASFTTTTATTAWTSNQLIANSATAASVTPITFANACRVAGGTGSIRRAQIQVASDTGFAGQSLVLALYTSAPTFVNGDRGIWLTNYSGFVGTIAVTLSQHFSDYEQGIGTPVNGSEINFTCAGGSTSISGALISAGTLTPAGASKTVLFGLEIFAN